MQLTLTEIDPQIAEKYVQTMIASGQTSEVRGSSGRLSIRSRALLLTSVVVPPVVGFGLANVVWEATHTNAVAWATWLSVWFGGTGAGCWRALRSMPKRKRVESLQLDSMRSVFPLLSLTRAERIYCDVLLFLARTETTADGEDIMRDTLRQLNELLASSRQLEQKRLSLLPLLGANVEVELQAEANHLRRRLEGVTDPIARASHEQSLRMITGRIETAQNLQIGLERLHAQQEAITQTLASAFASLGRMQITADQPRAEFAMQDISQTVSQMNQQTYAVEKAVEEVLMLRATY
jgi:hypothetical protein